MSKQSLAEWQSFEIQQSEGLDDFQESGIQLSSNVDIILAS